MVEHRDAIQAAADRVAGRLQDLYQSLTGEEQCALAAIIRYGATEAVPVRPGGDDGEGVLNLIVTAPSDAQSFFPGYLTDPSSPVLTPSESTEPLFTTEIRLSLRR